MRVTDAAGRLTDCLLVWTSSWPRRQSRYERNNTRRKKAVAFPLNTRIPCALPVFLAAFLLAPDALGGDCDLGPGNHSFSMQLDGVTRTYVVRVPTGCDPADPFALVFDFHALFANTTLQSNRSGFREKADEEGFVIVWPQGVGNSWNAGVIGSSMGGGDGLDDVAFARAVADAVEQVLPIDRSRIYATGHSNGGAMSHQVACDAADLFAAVVPVAFPLWPESQGGECTPSEPVAVLQFSGLRDTTVPYDGNRNFLPAPESNEKWAELNGCEGEPVRTLTQGGSFCDVYQQCADGVEVGLCSVQGPHNVYSNDDDLDVAELGWSFMSRFARSGSTGGSGGTPDPPPASIGQPGRPTLVLP
jgi:polyhydroxybutyrate depolymerase